MWRGYIAQRTREEGAAGQFEAMERMVCGYAESGVLKGNRYYTEVWLKYVS